MILFSIVKLFRGELNEGTRLYIHNKKIAILKSAVYKFHTKGGARPACTHILSFSFQPIDHKVGVN